ncbi:SDR family oxidoreductase [Frankia sp. AgB1.9]|uniref:SDR family NAD(P)-dependent oxidoreductase n=1 Tax=unclassified Frankia TaxID=2632575 RepID=UPI00193135D3|nr:MULTISPECIES: SDR family NAD(P)-dependent oxidoreductase [unclassified Frankia]MBL7491038.1 SDR family oxidoreductase [Frankia sp. AgW1.1]MBL7549614.1 SDR family oxidoreductase [Frankia sp. AgB1.9]MBL7620405.1 SDR family oxidoreductase [Frankia sp. AgB1.8]
MDLGLTDKRAIVTGASQGIGLAIAHALAAEGVDLVLAARSADKLERAAEQVAERHGRKVFAVATDTGDDESVRRLVDETVQRLGGVDILVNNASNQTAGYPFPPLAETTDEAFWADVNIKVVGYLRTSRAVAPLLTAQGWGRIINISGLGARQTHSIVRTIRNVSVAALTKNLADELGPHGVNVTVVHPGATRTETNAALLADAAGAGADASPDSIRRAVNTSIGRIVEAHEVADVVAFLASPRSVSITGDAIAAGGGLVGSVYY